MSFKTISFKTDWSTLPPEKRGEIIEAQIALRKEYERWANPEYFRKSIWSYIADGFREVNKEGKRG